MKLIKKSILLLALAGGTSLVRREGHMRSRRSLIDVAVDSAAILIGEQTALHLDGNGGQGYGLCSS